MLVNSNVDGGFGMSDRIINLSGILVWTAEDRFKAMRDFYVNVLGLMPRSDRDRFVNFEWSCQRLTISVHEGVSYSNQEPLRLMINLEVTDIHATTERLRNHGVVFLRMPEKESWGGWVSTFHDPDGNTLQLLQLPHDSLS